VCFFVPFLAVRMVGRVFVSAFFFFFLLLLLLLTDLAAVAKFPSWLTLAHPRHLHI
jgi:hypothetical protein